MKGFTVSLMGHAWRGFGRSGGPLGSVLRLGFISLGYSPFLIDVWVRNRTNAIKNAISSKDVPPRAEMSAWGEDRPYHKRAGQ